MKKVLVLAGLATLLAVPSHAATSTWNIDPFHANAQFEVRHLGISNVQGEFTKISGTVTIDDSDITKSSVDASIDVTSIDTRVSRRDDDLKSDGFFDATKFPTITFKSTKVQKAGEGKRLALPQDAVDPGINIFAAVDFFVKPAFYGHQHEMKH